MELCTAEVSVILKTSWKSLQGTAVRKTHADYKTSTWHRAGLGQPEGVQEHVCLFSAVLISPLPCLSLMQDYELEAEKLRSLLDLENGRSSHVSKRARLQSPATKVKEEVSSMGQAASGLRWTPSCPAPQGAWCHTLASEMHTQQGSH